MMFELKQIISKAFLYQKDGIKSVLATVVYLNGSSYRQPGVRMLITENGHTMGAVSGGCVEKEVVRQAQSVFIDGIAKIMTYDGRYRLGCEGVIYILIEPISLTDQFIKSWIENQEARDSIRIQSAYQKTDISSEDLGSCFHFKNQMYYLRPDFVFKKSTLIFEQVLAPLQRLLIIGSEHDAVQMCLLASATGMEVIVVTSIKDPRSSANFPGAKQVLGLEPDAIHKIGLDTNTAVILMNHNYSRDFQYTLSILKEDYCYFGIIGSKKRKNMLLDELIQFNPDADFDKVDSISSPAGLDIGSVTPQDIAVSVLAEIIATARNKNLDVLDNSIKFMKQRK